MQRKWNIKYWIIMDKLTKDIRNYIAEHPNCKFEDIATKSGIPGNTRCIEIWNCLKELAGPEACPRDAILIEGEKDKETFRLKPGSQCYVEAAQDMTILLYSELYKRAGDEADSRVVLREIRAYAKDFEAWWWNLPESSREDFCYLTAIEKYCDRILHPLTGFTKEENLQEFTAMAVSRTCYDRFYGYMMDHLHMSREDIFAKIREWADEFWEWYQNRDGCEAVVDQMSYYDHVDDFMNAKMAAMKK